MLEWALLVHVQLLRFKSASMEVPWPSTYWQSVQSDPLSVIQYGPWLNFGRLTPSPDTVTLTPVYDSSPRRSHPLTVAYYLHLFSQCRTTCPVVARIPQTVALLPGLGVSTSISDCLLMTRLIFLDTFRIRTLRSFPQERRANSSTAEKYPG